MTEPRDRCGIARGLGGSAAPSDSPLPARYSRARTEADALALRTVPAPKSPVRTRMSPLPALRHREESLILSDTTTRLPGGMDRMRR